MELINEYLRIHKRLYKYFPYGDDGLETILKGHLLIEELLKELLQLSSVDPDALEKAKLTFQQCSYLAEALYKNGSNVWVWKSIRELNKLRNRLAHKLEPKGLDDLTKNFVEFCNEFGCGYVASAAFFECSKLAMAIVDVHYQIWCILKMAHNFKNKT